MGEAYEALGPANIEPPPQPAAPPLPIPPPAQNIASGTAAGNAAATGATTKPTLGMANENTEFGIVSAYTVNSATAQPVVPEHSDSSLMKQKKEERTQAGTILFVICGILLGVSAIGVVLCLTLLMLGIEFP